MTQEEIKMDTVTFAKLEYITSGSQLTKSELYEIVDLMEQFAKEQLSDLTRERDALKEENARLAERLREFEILLRAVNIIQTHNP